jgi:hypothetical protein
LQETWRSLEIIRRPEEGLLRSVIAACHKSQADAAVLRKSAPISGDNAVEGSLAFHSKDAANFNVRYYFKNPGGSVP